MSDNFCLLTLIFLRTYEIIMIMTAVPCWIRDSILAIFFKGKKFEQPFEF